MNGQLALSPVEIIVLMMGAITLGITIHFFIISRRSLKIASPVAAQKINKQLEEWKLRYFNETEWRDKELINLKETLTRAEENNNINSIEAEELRRKNKQLQTEMDSLRNTATGESKGGYIEQIRLARKSLQEYNEKITQLLGQIDLVKETEEKKLEVQQNNEVLAEQVSELQYRLSQKEKELDVVRQKEGLAKEMSSTLDSVYKEFNILQDKIQRLESQVSVSRKANLEYEELKETHYKLNHDFDEQSLKYIAALTENQQLESTLAETDERLREANFQRQQLQKRVLYLEELNTDMQVVTETNKKLEGQLKKIGELESMLHIVSEERDQLARKQMKIS